MSTTAPSITAASFNALVQLGAPYPLSQEFQYNLPINFSNLANIQAVNGTWSPNNDYIYLLNSIPFAMAPNFLICTSTTQLNLNIVFTGASNLVTIERFMFLSPLSSSNNFIQSIYIEGRTNVLQPMAQGTPVTYSLIAGQATIS